MDEESKPTNNQPIPQVAPPDNQSDNNPNSSQDIQEPGSKTSSSTNQPSVSKDHPHANLPDPETIKTLVSPQDKPSPRLMKRMILLLLLLVTVFAGLIAYLGYKNSQLEDLLKRTSRKPAQELPTPTPTPDPTANWETYSNALYGFSIKYSPSLTPIENKLQNKIINVDFVNDLSDKKYEFQIWKNFMGGWMGKSALTKSINMGGKTGEISLWLNCDSNLAQDWDKCLETLNLTNYDSGIIRAYVENGDDKWYFTFKSWKKGESDHESEIEKASQILSTFKFTDLNDETVNWKTYLSQQFAYSFKYPPSWTVKETTNTTGLGDYIQTSILDEENNELIIINEDLSGIGCLEPPRSYPDSFQIGNQTVELADYCGTRNYFIFVMASNKYELKLEIYFVGKPNEDKGREILKSLENVTVKQSN